MDSEREELDLIDLRTYPVWYFDRDLERFFPLEDLDTPIESLDDLHFFAEFTTPQGRCLLGTITGLGDIAAGVFHNGRWYGMSRAWVSASIEQLDALAASDPALGAASGRDLVPLSYRTLLNKDPFARQGRHI